MPAATVRGSTVECGPCGRTGTSRTSRREAGHHAGVHNAMSHGIRAGNPGPATVTPIRRRSKQG